MRYLIGLSGKSGAGKDTVADYLVARHGFVRFAVADDLKRAAKFAFDFDDDQLWTSGRDEIDVRYHQTPRQMYQRLGDAIREIAPEAIVEGLRSRLRAKSPGHRLVVTDVRMPPEVKALRDVGGVIWRIERPGLGVREHEHGTETALDGARVDAVVMNDGSLSLLARRIEALLHLESTKGGDDGSRTTCA